MKDWRKPLIGQVKKMDAEEFEKKKKQVLNSPLPSRSVCRCVCAQCQNIFEADWEITKRFLHVKETLGEKLEISISQVTDKNGYYLEVNYCYLCEPQTEIKVEVKKK